jgi:hypothetical protein
MMQRFLPTLSQIREAAEQLPEAEDAERDEITISVNGSTAERKYTFERVRFKSRSRGLMYRWVYSGKVMVK